MTPYSGQPLQSLLRSVIDSSPSGLLLVDAEGKIVLVNREVERLFGYSREELLGKSVDILLPERVRSGHLDYRRGFMAAPRARSMGAGRDLYGLQKDGTEVPLEIGLTPLVTEDRARSCSVNPSRSWCRSGFGLSTPPTGLDFSALQTVERWVWGETCSV